MCSGIYDNREKGTRRKNSANPGEEEARRLRTDSWANIKHVVVEEHNRDSSRMVVPNQG
jgi:hypothetical protein